MNKCKINTIIQQYKTSLSRGQRDPSIMQILLCLLYSTLYRANSFHQTFKKFSWKVRYERRTKFIPLYFQSIYNPFAP